MTAEAPRPRIMRFGLYEADWVARELRREGVIVRLQERPFQILAILLESPGKVVTREELRQRLWPADTFVDFDASLNTSVNKLRLALLDSADNPRYIATAGRRGYRFIAPAIAVGAEPQESLAPGAAPMAKPSLRPRVLYAAAAILILALLAALALFAFLPQPAPKVLSLVQISHDGLLDPWGRLATDGARIFYLDRNGGQWTLMQVPAAGGEARPFPEPSQNLRVLDVSPDRSQLLTFPFQGRSRQLPLSLTPVVGGSTRQVSDILADDAVFATDGRRIFFSRTDGIYSCLLDGTQVQRLVALHGSATDLTWSREGERLRFTLDDPDGASSAIWEVAASGANLHKVNLNLPTAQPVCCGRWSTDGRYFFFTAMHDGLQSVWGIRDTSPSWLRRPAKPVQLTFGPDNYGDPLTGEDPRSVYVWSGSEQIGIFFYSPQSGSLRPFLPNVRALLMRLSPDGAKLAYFAGDSLWISDAAGDVRRQLASGFQVMNVIRWSPDGKRLLFQGAKDTQAAQSFIVSADGGSPARLELGDGRIEPEFSADGNFIVFSRWTTGPEAPTSASGIFLYDLKSARIEKIPGSENLVHPAPSPDGRLLAAVTNFDANPNQPTKVMLFDFASKSWKQIGAGGLVNPVQWSSDSKTFVYQDIVAEGQPAFRYSLETGRSESVLNFNALLRSGYVRCSWLGSLANGDLVMSLRRNDVNVYRLDLDLP
jgi:Tol biopolymer transport system component/DNA-binding winged helix-turn-helix (wHTH) protein